MTLAGERSHLLGVGRPFRASGFRRRSGLARLLAVMLAVAAVAAACGPDDDTGAELGSGDGDTEAVEETTDEADGDESSTDADTDDSESAETEGDDDGEDAAAETESDSETADADAETGDDADADSGIVPTDGPTVTVLDTGAEPRTELRIAVEAGDTETLRMTQSQTIEQRINGQAVPSTGGVTTAATTEITVESAEPGQYVMTSITSGSEVIEAPTPGAAAQAEAAMAELIGIGNRLTMDDRGRVLDSEPIGLEGLDNAMAEQLLGGAADQIASPLPDEAVGVGARWEVVQRIPLAGLDVQQVTVYEVLSIEGSVIEMSVTGNQLVAAGSIMDAQGIPAEVVSWDLNITGSLTQDLTSMVPNSAIEVSGTQAFQADGVEIEQDLSTSTTIEPG